MLIQNTKDDVVFSGHGSTLTPAGKVTRVPSGVEFYLLAPPGAGITDRLGQALERGERITSLYIRSKMTMEFSPHRYAVYTDASGDIPNMALHPPRGLDISGTVVPHIIGVEGITDLHDLWARATLYRPQRHDADFLGRVFVAQNRRQPLRGYCSGLKRRRASALDDFVQGFERAQQRSRGIERQTAWRITQSVVGARVKLKEYAIGTGRHRRLCQNRHTVAPPARAGPCRTWVGTGQLHRMGRINRYRHAELLHFGDRQHVDRQIIVAKA